MQVSLFSVFRIRIHFFPDPGIPEVEAGDQSGYMALMTKNLKKLQLGKN